jgi:hypothetical protein
MMALEVLNYDM